MDDAGSPPVPRSGSTPSPATTRAATFVLLAAATAVLVVGWKTFWFLTDDAYIAFRYVSNHVLGLGYVWNAPPFAPVEGYTSFGWVLLLEAAWRWLGVDPPRSANVMSLLFAFGSLAVTFSMLQRTIPDRWPTRSRLAVLAIFLAVLVGNRTFLAWASSGLETALFQFLLLLWVRAIVFGGRRRLPIASVAAAALALTRPDGLLFCGATLLVVVLEFDRAAPLLSSLRTTSLRCVPFAAVAAHLVWRHATYGAWLPNTYQAKYLAPWPESGARYAFCFIVEYALWIPLVLLVLATARSFPTRSRWSPATLVVIGAILGHFAYYTFVIGGDHFEYRVYVHLLPLVCVATAWALAHLSFSPRRAIALALAFFVASLPIPWTHWAHSRRLTTRLETHIMFVPVAPAFPAPLSWFVRHFDDTQAWLIERHVCMRHQEHLVFWKKAVRNCPSREEGSLIPRDGLPVLAVGNVGVPAWMFPNVNILDLGGLNDRVIARTPARRDRLRRMAHDRHPPAGYVESFRPNFDFEGTMYPPDGKRVLMRVGRYTMVERRIALTEGEVRTQESYWRERIETIRRVVSRSGKVY